MKRTIVILLVASIVHIPLHAAGESSLSNVSVERLDAFNIVQSKNMRKELHADAFQSGNNLTMLVTDRWNYISRDMKEAYIKDSLSLFFGMGGARGIKEKPSDLNVEVKHVKSGRTLATWDGLRGTKITDGQ